MAIPASIAQADPNRKLFYVEHLDKPAQVDRRVPLAYISDEMEMGNSLPLKSSDKSCTPARARPVSPHLPFTRLWADGVGWPACLS